MQIIAKEELSASLFKNGHKDKPVLVDQYICGREVEIDAICNGKEVFVPGIMELAEKPVFIPVIPSVYIPRSAYPKR